MVNASRKRLVLSGVLGLLFVACAGEVSAERRDEAIELAESLVTPEGFERVGEVEVEDPSFGVLGNEPGSIVQEWTSFGVASTGDVLIAFDPSLIEAGYGRVAIVCTPESLSALYWHPRTGSAVLDRSEAQGEVFVRLVSSWDEGLPDEANATAELTECSTE